jgi:[acyl-carrier-protein] S-malonyltransferase
MKTAYVFPGQGAQFTGMGKELYENHSAAKDLFNAANDILKFDLRGIMFSGSADELKQTRVTQPAIFVHSVAVATCAPDFKPDMVAGHSLGEFSALVANQALSFSDGLKLVYQRALAMQKACELQPSTMAAILGLDDNVVEEICAALAPEIVAAANYNCPGQLVISGTVRGVELACEKLKATGAKRALPLQVGGAFHSPLMEPAREELAAAIQATHFNTPICPVYQNATAQPASEVATIQQNLIAQLTAPVRWTQSVQRMTADGATRYVECGPGKVLQGLVKKISPAVEVLSA